MPTKGRAVCSPDTILPVVKGTDTSHHGTAGSTPAGVTDVPWRRPRKAVATRAAGFALRSVCRFCSRLFPGNPNATPVVKKSVTSFGTTVSRVRIPPGKASAAPVAQPGRARFRGNPGLRFRLFPGVVPSLAVVKARCASVRALCPARRRGRAFNPHRLPDNPADRSSVSRKGKHLSVRSPSIHFRTVVKEFVTSTVNRVVAGSSPVRPFMRACSSIG